MKCKIVTFEEVYEMVRNLSTKVKISRYNPTTIIGLARGAWVPARLMCDFLGITDLISLKIEHWLETGKNKEEATIRYPLRVDLKDKELLVIDDIADTGKSLMTATEYLREFTPIDIRTATMQYLSKSKFKPDYFAEEVKNWKWFIYPWNWIEDTSTLVVRIMETEKVKEWTVEEIERGLKEAFTISWKKQTLNEIIEIMIERGQVKATKKGIKLQIKMETK